MIRSIKRLLSVPVKTIGGFILGQVVDFEIETDTGRLQTILVRPSGIVKGLVSESLRVDWLDIIEIREDVILVNDSVSKESAEASVRSASSASMIMASEEE
jgi:sporulation protein YlmC with PRC-barrel domain